MSIEEMLDYIDPAGLDYNEWLSVGMALKEEGKTPEVWERWSERDSLRYHPGECAKKWDSFQGSAKPITGATIAQMAKDGGWTPEENRESYALDWDGEIGEKDDLVIINKSWLEGKELRVPDEWEPAKQLVKYIETLFEVSENVGYVVKSWEKDGKYIPADKGAYDRTAGQLIEALSKCGGDIGSVLGDYDENGGAWIRFNPLDGNGVKNADVTDFRYALVESDTMDIEKQNAIIRELELPVACLVHSGGKSLHAIVRIDASNYDEYRKRVDYLYNVCQKNGLKCDSQNRNPSRLSRMPGVTRNGKKQYLIDTNIGKESWNEWKEWIESVNDDLPDPESMADAWDNLPPLAPPLIENVLRMGHKMLIAGPSKAGKSFSLIELCCAVAEGKSWLGFKCAKGRILYVNLELDRASCLHRFKDVYTALGWKSENLRNIDIWNLRGKTTPMDKLAPKLIRRAAKKDYIAVVIDPIYKVITGDENSADQMAHFCNQFDKVCTELGCAVIYCHHHSKGAQGGKRSMDRASGSGVFARDPDALLDVIELEVPESLISQEVNRAVCSAYYDALCERGLEDRVENMYSQTELREICGQFLDAESFKRTVSLAQRAADKVKTSRTAWRIEGTLREFPKFPPVNVWFDYPVHQIDRTGVLKDLESESEQPPWKKAMSKRKPKDVKQKERKESINTAFEACSANGEVTLNDLAEYMGVTTKTVRSRIEEHGGFWIDKGTVGRKEGK